MRVEDVLLAMEHNPRSENIKSREFVSSVDQVMQQRVREDRHIQPEGDFMLMLVTRGVYIDCDLGTLDVIGYIANNVVSRFRSDEMDEKLVGKVAPTLENLRAQADISLLIAGFFKRYKDIQKEFFVRAGRRGYATVSKFQTANTYHQRFGQLAAHFEDYAEALEHTWQTYVA